MSMLAWAVALLAFGLVIVIVEMFVPSGGVLAVISAASLVASIVMAFKHSSEAGVGFMAIAVLGTPLLLILGFKYWPRTPLGRRILLDVPTGDDVLPDVALRRQLKELVGKIGTAKSLMLPSGPVVIAGVTYDALSEGTAVQAGERVKVIEIRGTRIVVRPTDEDLPHQTALDPNDPLNVTIDKLGLEPFERLQ
ncbi:MAG: NfeD family protein [Pirellulales bacterium]